MTLSQEKVHDFRILLLKESLEASKIEYSILQKDFSDLDTKAQHTTAIAGIFLAGSLAFYSGESLPKLIILSGWPGILLLGMAVLMLVVSVAFSIRTMRIREVEIVDSASANVQVDELLDVPADEWPEGHERFIRGQIEEWRSANLVLSATNNDKARIISRGQVCLSLAVMLVGLLLIIILLGAGLPFLRG